MSEPHRLEILRTEAWIGDAVLALFVREWLIERRGSISSDAFQALTSNEFLAHHGNPTDEEAAIGRIYRNEGLAAAYTHIERRLVPFFESRLAKRRA